MSSGGGASGRSGFEYQDVATAYFALTDKPRAVQMRPTEFRIESPSDFSFVLRFDDYDIAHYFEAKNRSSGQLSWSEFKSSILPSLSELADEHADSENTNYYHLITDVGFNRRLERFFENTDRLRDNNLQWPQFKKMHEQRNVDQISKNTAIENESQLAAFVTGLTGHQKKTREYLRGELEDFVRACNSPGSHRKQTSLLLRELNKKSEGVLRLTDLEENTGVSLRKNSSTATSHTDEPRSLEDIQSRFQEIRDGVAATSSNVQETRSWRESANTGSERLVNMDGFDSNSVESVGASIDENLNQLEEVEKERERITHSVGREAERMLEIIEDDSSDNKEDD